MALTQSARSPGPSWDEEVVPALRRRLQTESQDLARLISSMDDPRNPMIYEGAYRDSMASSSNHTSDSQRNNPNASSSTSRSGMSQNDSRINGTTARSSSSTTSSARTRTYSQPLSSDLPRNKANGANTQLNGKKPPQQQSSASRSTSPQNFSAKPTRIPVPAAKSRSRSGSNALTNTPPSGHTSPVLNGLSTSPTQQYPYPSSRNPDSLNVPVGAINTPNTASTVSVNSNQSPGLLHEAPPFQPLSSNGHDNGEEFPDRRSSTGSDEHAFEHWYRGDISRNGGVGELKVGKRKEMLDIAQYGHPINGQREKNAINDAIDEYRGRRKRTNSIGGIGTKERESFYMDEDRAREALRVMDEGPLTDFDDDGRSDYDENTIDYDEWIAEQKQKAASRSAPALTGNQYSRQGSAPPSFSGKTPQSIQRGASEPPDLGPSSSMSTPPGQRNPQTRSASGPLPGQQKRAVSPTNNNVPSASKKARNAAAKATRDRLEAARKEAETDNNRVSVAYYPTPPEEMDGIENAIPTWTQPVKKDGNWDDVVLPVVAKKKGLVDVVEQADGSPQQRKKEQRIEPAPGTFGWDHSKHRPPREDYGQPIQLDEFGRPRRPLQEMIEEGDDGQQRSPISTPYDEVRVGPGKQPSVLPPISPAPFSQYASNSRLQSGGVPPLGKMEVAPPPPNPEPDDGGAGCCKCVIM